MTNNKLHNICEFPGCGNNAKRSKICDSHKKQLWRGESLSPLRGKAWSNDEIEILKKCYADHAGKKLPLAELSLRLGRLRSNVSRKARELGLTDVHRKWQVPRPTKYGSMEEFRKRLPELARQNIRKYGHPRGALGMKHKPETLAAIAEKSRRAWAASTPAKRRKMIAKGKATKLAKYGATGTIPSKNTYSRCRRGKRDDIGEEFFRSRWEANYARYLNLLIVRGKILLVL